MSALFKFDIDGHRATITLDRPERHNFMEAADLPILAEHLDRLEADDGVRVLVLTGAGDRTFCAGFDIGAIAETDWSDRPLDRVLDRLEDLPIPTLCALNGSVFGGGADVALACDLRIGARGMRLNVPPARLGAHYQVSGMRRFVERLGLGVSKRLFLADETFSDEALLEIGYLDYLVAPSELGARADALAEDIAGLAPLALKAMKKTLNHIARGTLDEAAANERALACLRSTDLREGVAAYAEKRAPRFTGE